jgi:hypothetical protein
MNISFNVEQVFLEDSTFWYTTPCSTLTVSRRFGGIYTFNLRGRRIRQVKQEHKADNKQNPYATCLMLVTCLAYYLTSKIEANFPSETAVDFQRAKR